MACEHKKIKSENCVISCMECGVILPIDYLVGKDRIKEQNAAEEPAAEPKEAPKKRTTTKRGAK